MLKDKLVVRAAAVVELVVRAAAVVDLAVLGVVLGETASWKAVHG